jgi:hypothetical protein
VCALCERRSAIFWRKEKPPASRNFLLGDVMSHVASNGHYFQHVSVSNFDAIVSSSSCSPSDGMTDDVSCFQNSVMGSDACSDLA